MTFLQKTNPGFTYEVIIVDDGSKDHTSSVALRYGLTYGSDKVRVLTLVKNRGKGGAVRLGMLSARGKRLLFADADGATKFADLDKLEEVADSLLQQVCFSGKEFVSSDSAIVVPVVWL